MANHLTEDEPTGNIDGIDADALLEQVEKGGTHDIPMTQPEAQPTPSPEPTEKTAAQVQAELEFLVDQKQIKVPFTDPRVKQWASQGYDYSQKMAEFNRKTQEFEQRSKEFEQAYSPYKVIDDYAKQNPDWWQSVEQAWAERAANGQTQPSKAQLPPEFQEKLSKIEKFIADQEHQALIAKQTQEDQALSSEIQSIQEKYQDLDWKTANEAGLTLEKQILKHALELGLDGSKPGHFRTAFLDYRHEDLLKRAEERGKENQVKELQKRNKLGLLGKTPTPQKGIAAAENHKSKSYEELMREGLEELKGA